MRTTEHLKALYRFFFHCSPSAELSGSGSVLTSHVMPDIMFQGGLTMAQPYLQLAWETLEAARSIYSKMGDEKGLDLAGNRPSMQCIHPFWACKLQCIQTCHADGHTCCLHNVPYASLHCKCTNFDGTFCCRCTCAAG